MARKDAVTVVEYAKGEAPPVAVALVDYVCGLRRVGPSRYSLVTGTVVGGVVDLKVDPVSQSLDHAAEELRGEFQKLMETIP
jgi:hypothetical protein